ncbi:linear amide C-N hydrolase [Paraferrimonas sedimenticola]|uniref:Choloylglycine hydrolase/NAAA C-terminal domain-containing protein n=1 Tax=Paraferrimonas sedimenticola TaxID=375674 RepID=A0AA37RYS5_9GAMM|nr:linear amide C-N hydrolase [Paraferrimonas sedimenticola]GLP97621.1 hypothetical protein GCM10007895_29280 [Paraferrimonas sedimenticola]
MRKTILSLALTAVATFGIVESTQACTVFVGKTPAGDAPVIGRTIEFGFADQSKMQSIDLEIEKFPRGTEVVSADKSMTWVAKYGYIKTHAHDVAAEGINEAGLYVALLWFIDGEWQARVAGGNNLATYEAVEWMLGNFNKASDAATALKNINVYQTADTGLGIEIPAHWMVVDKTGQSFVIEHIDGEAIVTNTSESGVMTNSPKISEHTQHFSDFIAANPKLDSSKNETNMELPNLPGSYSAKDRYTRTRVLRDLTPEPTSSSQAVNQVVHIMNNTDYVRGVVEFEGRGSAGGSQETTSSHIADLENMDYYYRTAENMTLYKIDMNKVDFGESSGRTSLDPFNGVSYIESTGALTRSSK